MYDTLIPPLPLQAPYSHMGKRYYAHYLRNTWFTVYTERVTDTLEAGRYNLTMIRGNAGRGDGLVVNGVSGRANTELIVADTEGFALPPDRVAVELTVAPHRYGALETGTVIAVVAPKPPVRVVVRPDRWDAHALEQTVRRLRVSPEDAPELLRQFVLSAGLASPEVEAAGDLKPPAAAIWTVPYYGELVKLYVTADGMVRTVVVEGGE